MSHPRASGKLEGVSNWIMRPRRMKFAEAGAAAVAGSHREYKSRSMAIALVLRAMRTPNG